MPTLIRPAFVRPRIAKRELAFFAAAGAFVLAGFAGPAAAAVDAWSSIGPFGGSVKAIAIDSQNPSTLYAVSQVVGGVFKTTNGGAQWARISAGMTDPYPFGIVIDPTNHQTLYAPGGATLYKSTNGGEGWTSLQNGAGLYGLVVNPHSASTLYAIGGNGIGGFTVVTSSDGGSDWSPTGSGLPTTGQVITLTIDPNTPSTIYAGTSQGVYKTTTSGGSWSASNTGQATNFDAAVIVIDPTSATHLFAAGNSSTASLIYESNDAGAHWSAFTTKGLYTPSLSTITDLRIDPKTPSTLYVAQGYALQSAVFVNKGRASSWTSISSGLDEPGNSVNQLAINPTTTSTLYAATDTGVFATTDGGAKWRAANQGLANTRVTALAISQKSPATIYAGTLSGLSKSTNGGAAWTAINKGLAMDVYPPLPLFTAIAIDPSNPQHVLLGLEFGNPSNLAETTNGGASWKYVGGVFSLLNAHSAGAVYSIAFDPLNAKVIFAGTYAGLYRSTDGGESWTLLNPPPATQDDRNTQPQGSGGLSPGSAQTVVTVQTSGPATVTVTQVNNGVQVQVSYSTDSATPKPTWTPAPDQSGMLPYTVEEALPIRPADQEITMSAGAGNSPPGNGAYARTQNFQPSKKPGAGSHAVPTISSNKWVLWGPPPGINPNFCPPVTGFARDGKTPTTLYAGGNYGCGVLQGANYGQSVTPLNSGFPYQSLAVGALAMTPNGCDLYAGTAGGGVWRFTFKRSGC